MNLNKQQQEAVINSYDKDVVLSAIPGSGKTRTMIERIVYIINKGLATPEQIMCITFTKKSASEMIERLNKENVDTSNMAIGTFHSVLQKMLRKYGSQLGIKSDFEIIDYYTQYKIITDILMRYNIPYDKDLIKTILTSISSWKNELISSKLAIQSSYDEEELLCAKIYHNYMVTCLNKGLLDFDDILMYSYVLLKTNSYVSGIMKKKYKFILVDEYQDSNICQVKILQCLKSATNNLMAIGDVDQSIYGFRQARPECMTEFKKFFPNSKVMKLEMNYRSTQTIVKASHSLIRHNKQRIDSIPKTKNPVGSKIKMLNFANEREEARYIANIISFNANTGRANYNDYAIIYRINAMSREFEKALKQYNVPYVISGSVGFYDREEIRNILCFIKLKNNPLSEDHFSRCMKQIPGLGATTLKKIVTGVISSGMDFISAMPHFYHLRSGQYINQIYNLLTSTDKAEEIITGVITILDLHKKYLNSKDSKAQDRLENILELESTARINNTLSIQEFLDTIVLEKANITEETNCVKLMSIHSAKGLEFPTVILSGLEEGTLPFVMAKGVDAMEEERRLCYVGMTRAKDNLVLTRTFERRERKLNSSRFVAEIPENYMEIKNIN